MIAQDEQILIERIAKHLISEANPDTQWLPPLVRDVLDAALIDTRYRSFAAMLIVDRMVNVPDAEMHSIISYLRHLKAVDVRALIYILQELTSRYDLRPYKIKRPVLNWIFIEGITSLKKLESLEDAKQVFGLISTLYKISCSDEELDENLSFELEP